MWLVYWVDEGYVVAFVGEVLGCGRKEFGKVGIVIVCEIASAHTLVGACLAVFGKLYWG